MNWKFALLLSWGLLAGAAGCQPAAARAEQANDPDSRLRIVATTSLVGDVLSRVAGGRIELRVLLPPGADPHSFQSTPQDAAAVMTLLNGRFNFTAADRGGKIKGRHIDLFIPDKLGGHKTARKWGVRRMRIKLNGKLAE